jgi:hypothetical protein
MHWCYKEHDIGLIISKFNGAMHLMGCTAKIHGGPTRNKVNWCM